MPEDLVRWFSKRAGQIDLEVERLEAEGRERTPLRLVKWAVQATRKPKECKTPGTCMDGGGPRRPSVAWIRTLLSGR
jgi:hypothetical protein